MQPGLSKSEAAGVAGLRAIREGRASVPDTAAILRVTPPTILNRIKAGTLYAVRVGGKWWIPLEELQRLKAVLPVPSSVLQAHQAEALTQFTLDSNIDDCEAYYE